MVYFRQNGEVIEQYQVDFDREEVKKLKAKIIENCSFIKHTEFESDYEPIFHNKTIKNFTSKHTGRKKEYFEETRPIYLYSYDEYKPPYLVRLINQLLNGDITAVDRILDYDISAQLSIDDRIRLANQELNEVPDEDTAKKKEKLRKLEDLVKAKKINQGQQSLEPYYHQLMGLIKFNLINTLPISEITRIESFLGINALNKATNSKSQDRLSLRRD